MTGSAKLFGNIRKAFLILTVLSISVRGLAYDPSLNFTHYTNENGLQSSYVKSITQDSDGYIWLATRLSVTRFDGSEFREFPFYNKDQEEVQEYCNRVFMVNDSLLITRSNSGQFYYFDRKKECFKVHTKLNSIGVVDQIYPADSGYYILNEGKLSFMHEKNGRMENFNPWHLGILPGREITDFRVRGHLLTAITTNGLIIFMDQDKKSVTEYDIPDVLADGEYNLHYIDYEKKVWISEGSSGLIRFNPENGEFDYFTSLESGSRYIPHSMVHSFAEDSLKRIWIGTEAGLAVYDPGENHMQIHQYDPTNPNGLNTEPIYDLFCDRDGNMWLGTFFGGVNLWISRESFFRTWTSGIGEWQIGGNVVSCFAEDHEDNIWIGLEDMGLNKLNTNTGEVRKYVKGPSPDGLSYNNLHDLLFVDSTTLWIASYTGGINILNTSTNRFRHILASNTPGLNSDIIYCFYRLGDSILIGTGEGISVYDLKKKEFSGFRTDVLKYYQFESITRSRNKLWFSSVSAVYIYDLETGILESFDGEPEMTDINFVKADSKERIWIGDCYDGLICYDEIHDTILKFNKETGFPVSWIFSLQEGMDDWFWASSDKGLVRFSVKDGKSILYDNNSGIPFNQFNYRASFIDSKGNIYFGGNNGMVSFNENDHQDLQDAESVIVFTGLQLFNKLLQPGKQSPLNKSINLIDKLVFNYDQNVFTLEFKALNYAAKGRSQYAYYLEGFEDGWNYVGNRDFATYTNLSPGKYTFHIKASSNNIHDALTERTLSIQIRPPFWLSVWAFILYVALAAIFSIVIYKIGKNFEKSRALIMLERREKEHSEAIHKFKLEFFTNISHELKTPLTLILGPINKFLHEENLSPNSRKRLLGIEKNAHRLFHLINQLLEFRKIETGKESLQVSKTNIYSIVEGIAKSFENIIETKDIDFRVKYPPNDTLAWIDNNKVDKIVFNLLSNAFKFTPEGGIIEFFSEIKREDPKNKRSVKNLVITVSDTGSGIRPEMLNKVFDRFVHIDDKPGATKGSGIGLAYVKSLVNLHKGKIEVESELSVGTIFKVTLPVSKRSFDPGEIVKKKLQMIEDHDEIILDELVEKNTIIANPESLSRNPSVMLVEDNDELIEFIRESLDHKYKVVTANNGIEGLEKLKGFIPDLIISDVIMPEMDGFEFVTRVKSDIRTSHIPVILLTSKGGVENRLKGLKTGADFYIEKPFYPRILEQNIENIITTRQKLIENFREDINLPIGEIAISESDKDFMEKLTRIIKEHISDTEMDVTFLVREMGLSRSLLHLKLKGLVNCSTTEYIRAVRVKEAVKLISTGKCNISEAAYATGFSSPTYFTRRFKEFYGKSPREYFNLKNTF